MKLIVPNWKWFVDAPLSPSWRRRLELCLGVVVSGAVVVGLSGSLQPDPTKIAHGKRLDPMSDLEPIPYQTPPPSPPPPTMTPELYSAVQSGDLPQMKKHFRAGMPLRGLLSVAARTGKKANVVWLLEHGADIHDEEGSTYAPILAADADPELAAFLRERGAAEPSLEDAAAANAPNAVFRLLASHPNVNARGSFPLQAAAGNSNGTAANRRLIITRLLAEGADPNREWSGGTALAGAVTDCEHGEDTDTTECVALVRLLLDHGARVKGDALAAALVLEDARREAPLDLLLSQPLERGVTATALATVYRANPRDIKRLVAKGVDWAWQDGEEGSALPLLAAVKRGDRNLAAALIDAGAPVDVHFKDATCALGAAIDDTSNSADGARVVELLVNRGANVNRRFPDGRTPLFAAAEAGDLRTVNFLLSKGARVNDLVLDDMPLDVADTNGHQPVARVLHAHGARRARPQYPQFR